MARGVNKVILVGNLGNDVDLKYTQGGMAIATLSLATTSSRKNKEGGYDEKTEWHRVKLFGKTAEVAAEYLAKGSQVYIEGRIEYGKYTGQDGVEKYTTDIIGEEMQMLGSKSSGERPQQSAPRPQQGGAPRQAPARREPEGDMDPFRDDDIPF